MQLKNGSNTANGSISLGYKLLNLPFAMKKTLYVFVVLVVFLVGFDLAKAENTTVISESPVVSIGLGNGNNPVNNSPTHMGVYHGNISVFGTVSDSDIESYHFRVIKDGGTEGHTCTEELGLFSLDNQGYASSTLGKSACGFNYNKSEFISSGFTNSLLAIVNTVDLGVFNGEGDYWFILGARDQMGNRTNSDYTMDPRVKVIIDNTPPVTNGFVSVPGLEGPFTVQTTATDNHGVAQTNIYSAQSDGITCQAYTQAVSIAGSNATSSSMSVQWTPEVSGTYCVGIASMDIPGNLESVKTLTTEIHFQLPSTSTTTATTTPVITPTPTPTSTSTSSNSGSGSSEGSGTPTSSTADNSVSSSGGSGAGSNGPITNSFGVQNFGGSGGSITVNSTVNTETPSESNSKGLGPVYRDGIGGDLGVGNEENSDGKLKDKKVLTSNTNFQKSNSDKLANILGTTTSTSSDQLAQVITTGMNLNWLWWIILVVILLVGGYYFYFYSKK